MGKLNRIKSSITVRSSAPRRGGKTAGRRADWLVAAAAAAPVERLESRQLLSGSAVSASPGGYTAINLYTLAAPPAGVTSQGPIGYPQTVAPGGQVVGYGNAIGGQYHALLWSGAGAAADLNAFSPAGSVAYATDGVHQAGYSNASAASPGTLTAGNHAALWSGSVGSCQDLNPGGCTTSVILGLGGSQQVGWGQGTGTQNSQHAMVWSGSAGSAGSAADLNPAGMDSSVAFGVAGGQEVGEATGSSTGGAQQAALWTGNPGSFINLNPANLSGYSTSLAYATSGAEQVGIASGPATVNNWHAMLWSGTAASAVDLNPAGFTTSRAFGVNVYGTVGFGSGAATGSSP
jgi:hypothetical protein